MNRKGFAPIVILLVVMGVVLAGAAGYFAFVRKPVAVVEPAPVAQTSNNQSTSTATNETAGWKTYTNAKYHFSVNYPTNFIFDENTFSESEATTYPDLGLDVTVKKPFTSKEKEFSPLPQLLEISARSVTFMSDANEPYGLPFDLWRGNVETLAREIWKLAKGQGTASSDVAEVKIGSDVGYGFKVHGVIGVNDSGRAIDWTGFKGHEGAIVVENLWIFLRRNDNVFEIAVPITQDFKQIMNTIRFNN